MQVSAQEQACAEDVVKWATAVAAADGVHSSKDVQEGVVGACSSIRHPWPAVPELLQSALPDTPIERVMCATISVLAETAALASCNDAHAAAHTVAMRAVLIGSKCMRVDVTRYLPLHTMWLCHDTMFKPYTRSSTCEDRKSVV